MNERGEGYEKIIIYKKGNEEMERNGVNNEKRKRKEAKGECI